MPSPKLDGSGATILETGGVRAACPRCTWEGPEVERTIDAIAGAVVELAHHLAATHRLERGHARAVAHEWGLAVLVRTNEAR